jgi:2-aminoadipate transaminase
MPLLLEALERHLQRQGVLCTQGSLLVTSGGMEALSLGAWMVLDSGDTVVAEGPGFPGALSVFKLYGAKVVQLPCSRDGVSSASLDEAIERYRPKLVSLMPDHQNPTGATMTVSRRKEIAHILERYGVYALEDGAYSHLCFEGEPLPPLQSFAPDHVLYATSVSKLFAPAMRIGSLVAPKAFAEKAAQIKSVFNMQASAIHQAVTARFLDAEDYLQRHIEVLRNTYRARRDAIVAALEMHIPRGSGYRWNVPHGGMFLWLEGPASLDFSNLFEVALENGVAYVPGSQFYLPGEQQTHNAARLNFASTSEESIWEGIRRLVAAISHV